MERPKAYNINMLKKELMSNLATLMRNSTDLIQWRWSWLCGRKLKRTSAVSTVTINRNSFSVCYFYQWHAREERPESTWKFDSNHRRKNGLNHFARMGLDKLVKLQLWWGYFTHEWSANNDSPVPSGAGGRTNNRHQVSGCHIKFCTRIISRKKPKTVLCNQWTPPPPPFIHSLRAQQYTSEDVSARVLGNNQGYGHIKQG